MIIGDVLRRYWAESFRNFGIGLMVALVVLKISERISNETLVVVFLLGLFNVFVGAILIRGRRDE